MAVKSYEFRSQIGNLFEAYNPSFTKNGGVFNINLIDVTDSEFHRVLAEWEADQVEDDGNRIFKAVEAEPEKAETQSQWVPKVGDWVRVKESARTDKGALFQVKATWGAGVFLPNGSAISNDWLEPAEPQPIDKLGWWLINGNCECFDTRHDGGIQSDTYFVANPRNPRNLKGIFLAEITDEELTAYHREGIVPKCPVEV